MSCGLNSSLRLFMSVHQCIRNTQTNKELLSYRRFNTLKKALRPISSVKLSQYPPINATIRYEQDRLNIFLRKLQIKAGSLPCNFCSKTDDALGVGEKKEKEKEKEKVSIFKRYKTMFKEYWYVLIPVHMVTSCCWFGSFYYMAASGMDIPAILETCGAPESWIETFKSTEAGNVLVALALYKVVTPMRYLVTVGGTTFSINYLKQRGWIKPVPSKEQLKKMYQEQKDVFKDFKTTCQDKMQVTKTEFSKSKSEMKKQMAVAKEAFHMTMKETRYGFRHGVRGGAEEWKGLAQALKREIKENFQTPKKHKND